LAALQRPLLGQRPPLSHEDPGRAMPLAVLAADLEADLRVTGGRGSMTIQAMYDASVSEKAA
jgi:hypothetical protein